MLRLRFLPPVTEPRSAKSPHPSLLEVCRELSEGILQTTEQCSDSKSSLHLQPFLLSGLTSHQNRNITKAHIYAALDVGETWLRQAEDGNRLIGTFGAGGTRPVEEVIEEIAQERTPPRGSGQLYEFLSQWENAHPV
jgi:hypothetical protein